MSILVVFERALEILEHVNSVAGSKGWPTVSTNDAEHMGNTVDLLKPLNGALKIWESDGLTISTVYNGVRILIEHYEVSF
jgi:hypothetical protein